MPMLVYRACLVTGIQSNTAYYQRAVCAALARDLGLDYDTLVAELPPPWGPSGHLFNPGGADHPMARRIGPANTHEEVR